MFVMVTFAPVGIVITSWCVPDEPLNARLEIPSTPVNDAVRVSVTLKFLMCDTTKLTTPDPPAFMVGYEVGVETVKFPRGLSCKIHKVKVPGAPPVFENETITLNEAPI
jgi:hypothetical protein